MQRTCSVCAIEFESVDRERQCKDCRDTVRPYNPGLTTREQHIAILVSEGCNDKEIANVLLLSVGAVKVYLCKIYKKLGVTGRLALAMAIRNDSGIVTSTIPFKFKPLDIIYRCHMCATPCRRRSAPIAHIARHASPTDQISYYVDIRCNHLHTDLCNHCIRKILTQALELYTEEIAK